MGTVVESKAGLKTPAYAAQSAKSPLAPFTIERHKPRSHEVLIDIVYCGVCHSDIHMVGNDLGISIFPMVPGHEIVGRVVEVGDHVSKWKEGDIVGAAEFIPPAEQFNLMPMLDRWMIEKTFATLAEAGYARSMDECIVSINLSGQSLSDWELPDYIARKLDEYGIEPSCICFEITETVAFRDSEQALQCMHAIKALGCDLSLDDFGTGLSSFSYLTDLPVDYLKIDGSFVRKILDDKVSHALVASINQIGHVMGLKTVAEFVENDALAQRLTEMDIDYLQGYAIAKPIPLDDYLDEFDAGMSAVSGEAS